MSVLLPLLLLSEPLNPAVAPAVPRFLGPLCTDSMWHQGPHSPPLSFPPLCPLPSLCLCYQRSLPALSFVFLSSKNSRLAYTRHAPGLWVSVIQCSSEWARLYIIGMNYVLFVLHWLELLRQCWRSMVRMSFPVCFFFFFILDFNKNKFSLGYLKWYLLQFFGGLFHI